jgi:hypothetical protein
MFYALLSSIGNSSLDGIDRLLLLPCHRAGARCLPWWRVRWGRLPPAPVPLCPQTPPPVDSSSRSTKNSNSQHFSEVCLQHLSHSVLKRHQQQPQHGSSSTSTSQAVSNSNDECLRHLPSQHLHTNRQQHMKPHSTLQPWTA